MTQVRLCHISRNQLIRLPFVEEVGTEHASSTQDEDAHGYLC